MDYKSNNSQNKITKYNVNNYDIDLVVDGYNKDIHHFLNDINNEILECDKIYYKPKKNEVVYIVTQIDEEVNENIKYNLIFKEVSLTNENIYQSYYNVPFKILFVIVKC